MRTTIISLFLILSWFSQAQETNPYSFSMEEAIAHALEHNYSAINASRDIVDAQKQKWETIADGFHKYLVTLAIKIN